MAKTLSTNSDAARVSSSGGASRRRVFGQDMDPVVAQAYEALVNHYCRREDLPSTRKSIRGILTIHPWGCKPDFTKHCAPALNNLARVLDVKLGRALATMGTRDLLLRGLPEEVECCDAFEVYTVDSTDRRHGLRGHRGARVKSSVPPCTFIGFYAGRTSLTADYDEYKLEPTTPEETANERALKLESYSASIEHFDLAGFARDHGIELPCIDCSERCEMIISAYGNDKLTSCINDPSLDPFDRHCTQRLPDNTYIVQVLIGPWPHMVMFTKDTVSADMDLRYDYGPAFWTIVRENTKRAGAPPAKPGSGANERFKANTKINATRSFTEVQALGEGPDRGLDGQRVVCKKQKFTDAELEGALDSVRQITLAARKLVRTWERWRPNVEFWHRQKTLAEENENLGLLSRAKSQLNEALTRQRDVLVKIQRSRDGLEASIMNALWPLVDTTGLKEQLEQLQFPRADTKDQTPDGCALVHAILRPDHTAGPSNARAGSRRREEVKELFDSGTGKRFRKEDIIDLTKD